MIYYLSQMYSWYGDKEQPWEYARQWTRQLRCEGYSVFSPILHMHCFHIETVNRLCKEEDKRERVEDTVNFEMDYLNWALDLLKGMTKGDWKLKRIKGEDFEKYGIKSFVGPEIQRLWKDYPELRIYDSNITLVLQRFAFEDGSDCDIDAVYKSWKDGSISTKDWVEHWKSNECRVMYEYCKLHNIRVLDLKELLEGREKEL